MDQDGNLGFGTSTDDRYKLKILCDPASSNCGYSGQSGAGVGLEVVAQGSSESLGIIAKANAYDQWGPGFLAYAIQAFSTNSSYANVGVRGNVSDGISFNYGIWGQASGTNSYAGYFSGDVYVSGTITENSDERLKKNIRSLRDETDVLSLIGQLEAHRYEYRNESELRGQGLPYLNTKEGEFLGFIAQDVESVLPELVKEVAHLLEDESNGGREIVTTKAVNYNGIIPVLVAGIQEQQAHIEELEARLAILEAMMQN